MANYLAISAVGEALRAHLESAWPSELDTDYPCAFSVVASGELADFEDPVDTSTAVALHLYRVTINEQLRTSFLRGHTPDGRLPALPVDLHWMVSIWATSATAEHTILGWLIREIAQQPLLDNTLLGDEAAFADDEFLQVVPAELDIEDQMRVWDALSPTYRLSLTFQVRAVRIELQDEERLPMVAVRMPIDTADGTRPLGGS